MILGNKKLEHEKSIISCSDRFYPLFQIKLKKVKKYLCAIYVFVYLCPEFKSVT